MEFLLCNNAQGFDNGDILTIRNDGFVWGTGEINGSQFKIVRVPNEEMDDLATCQSLYQCGSNFQTNMR